MVEFPSFDFTRYFVLCTLYSRRNIPAHVDDFAPGAELVAAQQRVGDVAVSRVFDTQGRPAESPHDGIEQRLVIYALVIRVNQQR